MWVRRNFLFVGLLATTAVDPSARRAYYFDTSWRKGEPVANVFATESVTADPLPDAAAFKPPYRAVLIPLGHAAVGKSYQPYFKAGVVAARAGLAALVYYKYSAFLINSFASLFGLTYRMTPLRRRLAAGSFEQGFKLRHARIVGALILRHTCRNKPDEDRAFCFLRIIHGDPSADAGERAPT